MAEPLLGSASFEQVASSKIEQDFKASAASKLEGQVVQSSTTISAPSLQDGMQTPAKARNIGFFGTLGLAWLHTSNKAIGGAEIEFNGSPELLGAKDMDDILISNMMEAGIELDKKYMANSMASPELRYGLSIGMFYFIKGRLSKVREWFDAHKKKTGETDGATK